VIATVSGTVQEIREDSLVVQVGGVGLRVSVPIGVLETAGGPGRSITLHTHLQLRETGATLYGFGSQAELKLFGLLLAVSGVGPRIALAVLSTLSPEVLTGAVSREEAEVLERVPGIGRKTAQRLMFHLRDKLKLEEIPVGVAALTDVDAEVIAALTALGYSLVEAQRAVQSLPRDEPEGLEERVRLALSGMGS
jgi:Holliday junction DNA helicase RuvA